MPVRTNPIYEDPDPGDGTRVFVDRLWSRGVSNEEAQLDDWMRAVAPSDGLCEWFDHDPDRWDEFRERYHSQLDDRSNEVQKLLGYARLGTLTLVYAAADDEYDNAVALAEYLTEQLGGR